MTHLIHNLALAVRDGPQERQVPAGAKILHVAPGIHPGLLKVWYRRPTRDVGTVARTFEVVGTGHTFAEHLEYVGTVVGPIHVWHVLESLKGAAGGAPQG